MDGSIRESSEDQDICLGFDQVSEEGHPLSVVGFLVSLIVGIQSYPSQPGDEL
jgi:hypothetical protein